MKRTKGARSRGAPPVVSTNGDRDPTPVRPLPVASLHPNDYNPNRMTDEEFAELLAEVRHLGRLPKPVVVRPDGEGYVIVDGEHGWRAAKEAGLAEVPCEVLDADDFEAMRQTYKRNQHGTHNPVLLGRMFRRMMEARGLSARALAEEVAISEGTVRNAVLYAEAADLRNSYAPGADADEKVARLSVRQVRCYVRLPSRVDQLWFDAGCDLKALFRTRGEAGDDGEEGGWRLEAMANHYRRLEKTGLFEFVAHVYGPGGFVEAVRKVEKWDSWERGWLACGLGREQLRAYSRHFFEGKHWPVREQGLMDSALWTVLDAEARPPRFVLTADEFKSVLELCAVEGESTLAFLERLKLAASAKGHKPHKEARVWTKRALLERQLQAAPAYLRESALSPEAKYALWRAEGPEDLKRELARGKRLPLKRGEDDTEEGCRKCLERLVWERKKRDELRAVWEAKSAHGVARELAGLFAIYDPQKDAQAVATLADKLATLTKAELLFFWEYARNMEMYRALGEALADTD